MVAKKDASGRNSSKLGGKKRRLTGKQPRSQADNNGNDGDDEELKMKSVYKSTTFTTGATIG
jgi:hypothetical protein